MDMKKYIFLGLLALLLVLLLARNCGGTDADFVEARVSKRYLVCTHCDAQYEIPAEYFRDIDPGDMERGDTSVAFRCRECGEIAAHPGMLIEMNGRVVGVSGEQYDEERGIDEM